MLHKVRHLLIILKETIGVDRFELLGQFYFAASIAYWFDMSLSLQDKTSYQIRALQAGCRCYFTTLHTRRDGLTRLQTMILHVCILLQ
jgi:hypothetical protein